ncbi:hypothetical protein [Streptomyces viridochromogenes]|uniref:Uncharacterized protein n=1 Tax=Streptomyces viridochromogenes Tue57 TaxID=1160705 RepID=L8PSB9_STRVR|nr:hypothetical protein [Streptomyces viridochromogenes]ELS58974.1 hypothetical protein STVIR_0034 [Streptomyces viridochromogenes Tue57]
MRAGKYADAAVPAVPTALVAPVAAAGTPVVPAAPVGSELDLYAADAARARVAMRGREGP